MKSEIDLRDNIVRKWSQKFSKERDLTFEKSMHGALAEYSAEIEQHSGVFDKVASLETEIKNISVAREYWKSKAESSAENESKLQTYVEDLTDTVSKLEAYVRELKLEKELLQNDILQKDANSKQHAEDLFKDAKSAAENISETPFVAKMSAVSLQEHVKAKGVPMKLGNDIENTGDADSILSFLEDSKNIFKFCYDFSRGLKNLVNFGDFKSDCLKYSIKYEDNGNRFIRVSHDTRIVEVSPECKGYSEDFILYGLLWAFVKINNGSVLSDFQADDIALQIMINEHTFDPWEIIAQCQKVFLPTSDKQDRITAIIKFFQNKNLPTE